VIVVGHLRALGNDLSIFVRTAPPFAQADEVSPSLRVLDPAQVYDGQFFYRLAVDPLAVREVGIRFDHPSYRQQRILYPLIAYVLSAGRDTWVPFVLVAINGAGLVLLGGLGARFAIELDAPAWWGCLLPLWAGFTYTLARDLSEITQACFLVGTLLAMQRRRPRPAAVLMALAVLARETAVILAVAILIWSIARRVSGTRKRVDPAWLVGAAGLASYLGLQAVLWVRWGTPPLLDGSANVAMPVTALVAYWGLVAEHLGQVELAVFGLLVGLGLLAPSVPGYIRLALIGYICLLLTLSAAVWDGDVAWLRAATEAAMLASVSILHAGPRRLVVALAAGGALWPAVARWAIGT